MTFCTLRNASWSLVLLESFCLALLIPLISHFLDLEDTLFVFLHLLAFSGVRYTSNNLDVPVVIVTSEISPWSLGCSTVFTSRHAQIYSDIVLYVLRTIPTTMFAQLCLESTIPMTWTSKHSGQNQVDWRLSQHPWLGTELSSHSYHSGATECVSHKQRDVACNFKALELAGRGHRTMAVSPMHLDCYG